MNKTVKWLGLSVVALLLILVIAKVLVGRNADEIRVTVAPVKRLTIKETVNATGRLYPGCLSSPRGWLLFHPCPLQTQSLRHLRQR